MKNWAMIVAAAALSGLPFSGRATEYPTPMMFAGIVVVYTFISRFFIRAILCYINLVRWNVLQSDCVELKLVRVTIHPAATVEPKKENFFATSKPTISNGCPRCVGRIKSSKT